MLLNTANTLLIWQDVCFDHFICLPALSFDWQRSWESFLWPVLPLLQDENERWNKERVLVEPWERLPDMSMWWAGSGPHLIRTRPWPAQLIGSIDSVPHRRRFHCAGPNKHWSLYLEVDVSVFSLALCSEIWLCFFWGLYVFHVILNRQVTTL